MSVVVKQTITIEAEGQEITGIPIRVRNVVRVTCDNPNCQRAQGIPENAQKGVKSLEWDENNPESVPEDAYHLLTIEDFVGKKLVYCSKGCLQSALLDLKYPKPPGQQNVIPFPEKTIQASSQVIS